MEIEVSKDSKKKSARGYFSQNSNRRHSFDECKERTFCIGLLFGMISIPPFFLNFKFLMILISILFFYENLRSTKIMEKRESEK